MSRTSTINPRPAKAEQTHTAPVPKAIEAAATSPDEQLRQVVAGELRAAAADRLQTAFDHWLRYYSTDSDIAFLERVFETVTNSFGSGECRVITAALLEIPDELLIAVGTGKLPKPRPEWSTRHAWDARKAAGSNDQAAA